MGEDIRESFVPFNLNRYSLEEEIKELTTYCLHDVRMTYKVFEEVYHKYEAQLDIKSPKSLEIEKIYILKDYQSKGLGKTLLNEIIRIAKNDNKEFIWSGVLEKNKNAISFYNKNGFKQIGRFPFKVENYIKTGFIMQRDIK